MVLLENLGLVIFPLGADWAGSTIRTKRSGRGTGY